MTKKRPSIKGKGAEIFLSKEEDISTPPAESPISPTPIPLKQKDIIPETQPTITPSKQQTIKPVQGKATFYLPSLLLDNLDETWLKLRKKNRKLRKSEIVRIALEKTLDEYKENQQDSILAKHYSGKT